MKGWRRRQARRRAASALAVGLLLVMATVALAAQQEQVLRVDLQEWQLGFRTVEVQGGRLRVEVVNGGRLHHAFEIRGPVGGAGFTVATETLQPGQRAVLVLELPAGEYEVFCPVPGHAQAGMTGRLVVRAGG
ncbi:MAG TPA: cupredoxin domain-containing protein [Limnochordales bacterium]|uniref:Cupredoxin domain-containing protein n=1 Tax=Geochorda subterranea TaxID=3109564 RepID=A0ABZ1BMI4_9FIRM|nr:cupredoxin domain-containing protein [Limnochorda sp. LNt]WRP13666.1 cupredoxin domain-containing protein [Limnochorda sp. LNt]